MGDVTIGVGLGIFGPLYRAVNGPWFGNYAIIRTFRALDWPSNIFVSKVMTKKRKFWQKCLICPHWANVCSTVTHQRI